MLLYSIIFSSHPPTSLLGFVCVLQIIDDKNIDFRIKNIKKHVFFTFIKNIKKTCIKNIKTTGVIKWV